MRPDELLPFLFAHSEKTKYRISLDLGHNRNWAQNQALRSKNPTVATVAEIAAGSNMTLAILDKEGRVIGTVDPPTPSSEDPN